MDTISSVSMLIVFTVVAVTFFVIIFWLMSLLRRVVSTNEVHVVRSKSKTVSYGTGQTDKKDEQGSIIIDPGTVYYAWPSWLPILGVDARTFPKSIWRLQRRGSTVGDAASGWPPPCFFDAVRRQAPPCGPRRRRGGPETTSGPHHGRKLPPRAGRRWSASTSTRASLPITMSRSMAIGLPSTI